MSNHSFCVATDSACDLPADFIRKHSIRVLPIHLKLAGEVFTDERDPEKTVDLYKNGKLERNIDAVSYPASSVEISRILETELALRFDKILAITISSTRSQVYQNVSDAVFGTQPRLRKIRDTRGLSRNFRIKVMDSLNLFTGQGVLVYEAIRLQNEEKTGIELATLKLEALRVRVRAFLLPDNLFHLRKRASTKGDESATGLFVNLGNLLNVKPIIEAYQGETSLVDKAIGYENGMRKIFGYASRAIEKGLSAKVVVMSYAGDLDEIKGATAYQEFIAFARLRGVPTLLSVMSTTAAINVGPRSFSLAYAD